MKTTAELLSLLNAHRISLGKQPLKAWKDSRAKLEAAIAKEHNIIGRDLSNIEASEEASTVAHNDAVTPEEAATGNMPEHITQPAEASVVTKSKKPNAAVKELEDKLVAKMVKDRSTVTLADIARELGANPKILRAKMRRLTLPEGAEVSKHVYKIERKNDIIAFLKTDFRKKQ